MTWMKRHSPYIFAGYTKAISGATALDVIEAENKTSLSLFFRNTGAGALTAALIEESADGTNYFAIDSARVKNYTTLKTLAATSGKVRVDIITRGAYYLRITLTGSTTVYYDLIGYDLVTAGDFTGTGGGTAPLEVFVLNDRESDDYSTEENDFTATPTNGTSLIVLSVDTLGGMSLTENHFNNATLRVYQATTKENIAIELDDYTWTPGTKTLDVTNCTNSFTFATGDIVSLTIPAPPKAYDKTNNANIVEGNQTEAGTPIDKMINVAGKNVAGAATKGLRVDDPANILATTPALASFDKNSYGKLTSIEADTDDLQQCIDTVNNNLATEEQSPASIAEEGALLINGLSGNQTSAYQTPLANGKGRTVIDGMITSTGAGSVVINVLTRYSSTQTTVNTPVTQTLTFSGIATLPLGLIVPNGVREYAVQIVDAGGIANPEYVWASSRGNE